MEPWHSQLPEVARYPYAQQRPLPEAVPQAVAKAHTELPGITFAHQRQGSAPATSEPKSPSARPGYSGSLKKRFWSHKLLYIILILCLLAIIALSSSLGVVLSKKHGSSDSPGASGRANGGSSGSPVGREGISKNWRFSFFFSSSDHRVPY